MITTSYSLKSRQNGFTLIEVLVASFIMFLVITSATLIYRGAVLSSVKAEKTLVILSYAEMLTDSIKSSIRNASEQQQISDSRAIDDNLSYQWQANVIEQSNAQAQFNAFNGEMDTGKHDFKLWQVSLVVQMEGSQRQFTFYEVSW